MGWLPLIVAGAAGLAAMRAAMDRGDIEEAARQGALAGTTVLEQALAAPDRPAQLAAIAAAPAASDQPAARAELLPALARVAAGPDRRTAIPAARAAREIARSLYGHARPPGAAAELPDDLAPADVLALRQAWAALAARTELRIEVRVLALDTAAALEPGGTGVDLAAALADPDPAYRRAAIALVPMPVPPALRGALAGAAAGDADPGAALDAAAVLCADLAVDPPRPILDALGPRGLARLRELVAASAKAGDAKTGDAKSGDAKAAVRSAARCLAADGTPESAAALKAIRRR
ncbi:MAG TPA: hypothetical protein VNO30_22480 [Kofleriaceae bacterium]|nr:hypothetical protein [Kofleriaceae bacterium]